MSASIGSVAQPMNEVELSEFFIDCAYRGDYDQLNGYLSTVTDPCIYLNRTYKQSSEQKCTLLVIACLEHHFDFISTLLQAYKVDLEILNNVRLYNTNDIEELFCDVSLLWVAAVTNQLDLVQLLVEHGADVNHRTRTSSTPLRGASYHGNVPMARYLVAHGADVNIHKINDDTNLMLSVDRQHVEMTVYLIEELKCDINFCSKNGRSALYDAVYRGSMELVTLLLNHGALNFRAHSDQMSPLMWAAEDRRKDLMSIIEPNVSMLDAIEADELYASAFLRHSHRDFSEHFNDLYRALERRLVHQAPKELSSQTHPLFHYRQESQTLEELENVRDNPDEIIVEAFLIRERLLGTQHSAFHYSLRYQAMIDYADQNYQRALDLGIYELKLCDEHSVLFESDRVPLTLIIIREMIHQSFRLPIEGIETLFKALEHQLRIDEENFDWNLTTLLWLITILSQYVTESSQCTSDDRRQLKSQIRQLVQRRYKTKEVGSSLLHLCLDSRSNSTDEDLRRYCQYPCLRTTRLLLQCGADIDATDDIRNTPLHTLVSHVSPDEISLVHLLIQAGAHLDAVNALGETAKDLAASTTVRNILQHRMQISLKCLCAREIRQKEVPYHGKIPKSLTDFVDKH